MKAVSDSAGNLVVTNREVFIRVLLAAALAWTVGVWFIQEPVKKKAGATAILLLFDLALLAGNEKSSFLFDRSARVVRWRKDTIFRHASGEIPFASITSLSLERSATSSGARSNAKRLVLHTDRGVVPMTTAYTGVGDQSERVGKLIQSLLNDGRAHGALPFVT